MLMIQDGDDIIMKDNTSRTFSTLFGYVRPRKRTYIEMLNDSKQVDINKRIDNYLLNKHVEKNQSIYLENNNNEERDNSIIKNFDDFNNINNAKKNLMIKRTLEYDEEKERKWVENYYRIKNAELNRLRFGSV